FLEIVKFLSNIPPEDQLNPAAMVKHIGSYCYQPGHEVLKEFYLKSYNSINPEDIKCIEKKTGDPDDEADGPSTAQKMLENEGRDACQDIEKWATEMTARMVENECRDIRKYLEKRLNEIKKRKKSATENDK
ncbi:MAG: hypothetical protein ACRCU2_03370, partial [Planktothrix sp.]